MDATQEILTKLNNNNSVVVSGLKAKFTKLSKELQKYSDLNIAISLESYTISFSIDISTIFDIKAKMDKIIHLVNSFPIKLDIEYNGYSGLDRIHNYLISPDDGVKWANKFKSIDSMSSEPDVYNAYPNVEISTEQRLEFNRNILNENILELKRAEDAGTPYPKDVYENIDYYHNGFLKNILSNHNHQLIRNHDRCNTSL